MASNTSGCAPHLKGELWTSPLPSRVANAPAAMGSRTWPTNAGLMWISAQVHD